MVRYAHKLVPFQHDGPPTVNFDRVDTAGVGKTFAVGDEVLDTSVSPTIIYECKDNSIGTAIWDRIDSAKELAGRDISNTQPKEGQVLVWNDSIGKWEPKYV